ncbi:MAG: ATP-binding protein [Acidimicrobiia bacterium]
MAEGPTLVPNRFRRRLTAAFVLVAAVSAGIVSVVTYGLAREYRWRSFRSTSLHEARVILALAPAELDDVRFEQLRAAYEPRTDADVLAIGPGGVHSSSPAISLADVPTAIRQVGEPGVPDSAEAKVGDKAVLVIAAAGDGDTTFYFFFSLRQLEDSLGELWRTSLAAWSLTVLAAGAVGQVVARTTLRPVGEVAGAAEAIAAGDLGARLPVASNDEFGALAGSFNHMADEVEEMVAMLEAAAQRQRQFTADVAHELRTPLTGMSVTAAVLDEMLEELPAQARRMASLLVTDVARLRDLVLELLELSRLEATGGEPSRKEPLRIADAVEAVVRSADLRRSAAVAVEGGDLVVHAEPAALRRILSNLLDNAVRHGAANVAVRAASNGDGTVVAVEDDGPGIPEGDLPRIFDRFVKSDRSRAAGGSGLGLAIARQHAVAMGGDLTVTSRLGEGARFTLWLPAPAEEGGVGIDADDLGSSGPGL